jgi:hypothetical protein
MTVLFFCSGLMSNGGLPGMLASKQREFFALKGTAFQLDTLHVSAKSFLAVLPQAIVNTLARLFPWEAKGLLQGLYAAEVWLFLLLIAFTIIKRGPEWKFRLLHPVILLLLFFSASVYLFIGYTVPFPGAIARYKAIPELFMVSCLCCIIGRFTKKTA